MAQESQDWNKVRNGFHSITRGGFPITQPTLILPSNIVYHPSSPSFTDVGVTSPRATPITYQWMTPAVGISQQPTIHTMAPYLHGRSGEQAGIGKFFYGYKPFINSHYIDPRMAGRNRGIAIEMLPDNTLLEIFDFYRLDAIKSSRGRPWKWHRLAHVCQKWRNVVQMSPRRLGLQIYCKSGASIQRILGAWPTLPLVVRFKGTLKSRSLPKNVVIALGHPDRVCEIDLTVNSSIIGSIVDVIQVPYPALECIKIKSEGDFPRATEPPVFGTFLGGFAPHLKEIDLEGVVVPFPTLRRLLLSTDNLVTLCLMAVPDTGCFSPDALVTVLSSLAQLKVLGIFFRSSASTTRVRPPPERAILPSLTTLVLRGPSEYLEDFIARIDSPVLAALTIKFFNQLIFEIPQICRFMSRVEGLQTFNEVRVVPIDNRISVKLGLQETRERDRRWCSLYVLCRQLDWQLSFTTQILSQIRPFLSSTRTLLISRGYRGLSLSLGKDDVDPTQWLELFQPFSQVSDVRVEEEELVPDIMHALVSDDVAAGLLPSLTTLYLKWYHLSESTKEAAARFVAARKAAGRSIKLRG
jgi:hypothetical protein